MQKSLVQEMLDLAKATVDLKLQRLPPTALDDALYFLGQEKSVLEEISLEELRGMTRNTGGDILLTAGGGVHFVKV